MTAPPRDITKLLLAWGGGDSNALDELMPVVHDELYRRARHYMAGERQGHTLQATALVNEVYLRLVDARRVRWRDRSHFFAVSAQLMRRILVDFARARGSHKRGGDAQRVTFDEALAVSCEPDLDLIALDDALCKLAVVDERKAKVVDLRFFGGLTAEESAAVLGIAARTVRQDWEFAKIFLLRTLETGE